jgi:hypothetical protein
MDKRLVIATFVCGLLLSFAVPAFAQPDIATDLAVPDAGSLSWLVGLAAASLVGFRMYLGKKR